MRKAARQTQWSTVPSRSTTRRSPRSRQTLEKRFGRKLQVTVELAPELIGGIRVRVGDEVLDTSVKARLEQMKVALAA